ncbi:hypothetical protein D3C72_2343620 [compost metagenome]
MDSGQNRVIPGAVTLSAFINKPNIDILLLCIYPELFTAIEGGGFFASMTMDLKLRRF